MSIRRAKQEGDPRDPFGKQVVWKGRIISQAEIELAKELSDALNAAFRQVMDRNQERPPETREGPD